MEKTEFDLLKIFSLKCSIKEPSFCFQCESCRLIDKINCTKVWFGPLGYTHQQMFLEKLIISAPDLVTKLSTTLYSLRGKDYQYAKSRLEPSGKKDGFQSNTDHSLDICKIECIMTEYFSWFIDSTVWTRSNYLLVLLQLCSTQLLDYINEFVITAGEHDSSTTCHNIHPHQIDDKSYSAENYHVNEMEKIKSKAITKCRSVPHICQKNENLGYHFRSCIYSAWEGVTFDEEIIHDCNANIPYSIGRMASVASRSLIRSSQNSAGVQICAQSSSAARCTPLLATSNYICGTNIQAPTVDYTDLSRTKGFMKYLPVHLIKNIFGYLDETSLKIASCVSHLWNYVCKEVKAETIYIQQRKEDVMLMQSTGAKIPNPCYARHVPLFIPELDAHGNVQLNTEGRHIDVEIIYDEFADLNMESCYYGFETRRISMEEKNVFCSTYNVLMLESHHDLNRHIYYDGGKFILIGSHDRKIHVINVNTGDILRTICGHSGSIKCLHLDENNQIAISGSYDTSIRIWNLKNGKCKVVFLGHQGTVVCIAISKQLLVSSSVDCTVKLWDILTGKCKSTLTHSAVIKSINIDCGQIIGGSSTGNVISWNIKTCDISKEFRGHHDTVTCLKSNYYFIFSGSIDGFVRMWNNIGNLNNCLKTFQHPNEVLSLDVSFCRLITGCFDGKIRVWNMLNGNCLRVIRGNSKNDPISYIFACNDRLVVNTLSSILVYNFESVKWNYSSPREQGEGLCTINANSHGNCPYSYTRAQKLIYHGSPLHKANVKYFKDEQAMHKMQIGKPQCINDNTSRSWVKQAQSAPIISRIAYKNKLGLQSQVQQMKSVSRLPSSLSQHISRMNKHSNTSNRAGKAIRSTYDALLRKHVSGTAEIHELKETHMDASTLREYKEFGNCIYGISNPKPYVRTRCRSAPLQRVVALPPNERGSTTSSFTLEDGRVNKRMVLKIPSIKNTRRPRTAILSQSTSSRDLKLQTFHCQLYFEEAKMDEINEIEG